TAPESAARYRRGDPDDGRAGSGGGEELADALLAHLDRGAQLLGEETDAQLLDQPADLLQCLGARGVGGRVTGGGRRGLVLLLQLAHAPGEVGVLVDVVLRALHPPARGPQVAGEVDEAVGRGA